MRSGSDDPRGHFGDPSFLYDLIISSRTEAGGFNESEAFEDEDEDDDEEDDEDEQEEDEEDEDERGEEGEGAVTTVSMARSLRMEGSEVEEERRSC